MTDRPILFSAPMVRALLDGRKTQTRRVIDFLGIDKVLEFVPVATDKEGRRVYEMKDGSGQFITRPAGKHFVDYHFSPRYAVGDRLWVREAWRAQEVFDTLSPAEIGADFEAEHGEAWCPTFYEADRRCDGSSIEMWQQSPPGRLRASMHMPRWTSRLTLTVADVRVQRLQAISEREAKAEGLEHQLDWLPQWRGSTELPWRSEFPRDAFRDLWDSINAARGYGWDVNPWVVAVTFTVERRNIDEVKP